MQFLLILFLLISQPVWGATQQILEFGNNDTAQTGVTEYQIPTGSDAYDPTEANRIVMWPSSGTIDDLRVEMETSPQVAGGTQSFTFTLRLDTDCDGTGADTSLTCTISEDEVTCTNSDGFSINAGECVAMEITPSGTPGSDDMWWSMSFTPTTEDETVMVTNSSGNSLATSGTEYIPMHAAQNSTTVAAFDRATLISTAGTFKSLYVKLATAPGVGTSRTFAFGTVDCTVSGTDTTCNSSADTQAVTAGEKYTLTSTVSGTPAGSLAQFGIIFDPTNKGEWIIAFSDDDDLNTTTTEYSRIHTGDGSNWSATESTRYQALQTGSFAADMDILNMYVELETDPGVTGDIFTFTLMQNAVATSLGATCDGVQTCNGTATINISDDDLMDVRSVPTSSPTVGSAIISYTGFITPTADAVEGNTTIYSSTIYNATIY